MWIVKCVWELQFYCYCYVLVFTLQTDFSVLILISKTIVLGLTLTARKNTCQLFLSHMLDIFTSSWPGFPKMKNKTFECAQKCPKVLHNLRSGIIIFFTSLLLWLEREKSNALYIDLTTRQPPSNLHNLTSAWPVMLLANQCLPNGNQILERIMSLLKLILGKRNQSTPFWHSLKSEHRNFV